MASLSFVRRSGERRGQRPAHRADADRVRSRARCRAAPNAWPRWLDALAAGHRRAAPPGRDVCVAHHPAPARRRGRRRRHTHGRRVSCPAIGAEADRRAGCARGRGRCGRPRSPSVPQRPGLSRVSARRGTRTLGDARHRHRAVRCSGSRSRSAAIRRPTSGGRVAGDARDAADVPVHVAGGWLATPRAPARAGARARRRMVLYAEQRARCARRRIRGATVERDRARALRRARWPTSS